jgi:hypothetical protein
MHRTLSLFSAVALFIVLPACSTSASPPPAPAPNNVVINELYAVGDEWIELYNKGDRDFDLGSYALADTDKDTGQARTTQAMRFPSGTLLPKGGFLLVLAGKKNSTPGPYSPEACLKGVSVGCFYALFSMSEARGEAVHLLAPDNTTLSSTNYPANLEYEAGTTESACRLPDGTGDLTECTATPGAPNAAP